MPTCSDCLKPFFGAYDNHLKICPFVVSKRNNKHNTHGQHEQKVPATNSASSTKDNSAKVSKYAAVNLPLIILKPTHHTGHFSSKSSP